MSHAPVVCFILLLGTINYWDYQGFVLFMPVGLTNKQVTEIEWETGPRDWRVA